MANAQRKSTGAAERDASKLNPRHEAAPGTPGTGDDVCPECHGSGRISGQPCRNCGGSGRVVRVIGGA